MTEMRDLAERRRRVFENLDGWLVLAVAALCLVGIVFIGSATADDAAFGAQQGRQALFVAIGMGCGFFVLLPHYVHILRGAWLFYGLVLLALLGLPFFAPEINGARRWYALPGFSVQPSEFAKVAVVLALAAMLRFKSRAKTFDGLLLPALVAGVPALLILKQPDLGTSLLILASGAFVLFIAGLRWRWIIGAVAAVVPVTMRRLPVVMRTIPMYGRMIAVMRITWMRGWQSGLKVRGRRVEEVVLAARRAQRSSTCYHYIS